MRTITVTGTSSVSAAPDTITLSITASALKHDYSEASAAVAEKLTELLKIVKDCGYSEADLRTTSLDVSQRFDTRYTPEGESETSFQGYFFNQVMEMKFGSLDGKLNTLLSGLSSGEESLEFSLSYSLEHDQELRAELLTAAAKDARRRAQILCSAAGAELGKIQSITHGVESAPVPAVLRMNKMSIPQIQDVELTESAVFVWEIR